MTKTDKETDETNIKRDSEEILDEEPELVGGKTIEEVLAEAEQTPPLEGVKLYDTDDVEALKEVVREATEEPLETKPKKKRKKMTKKQTKTKQTQTVDEAIEKMKEIPVDLLSPEGKKEIEKVLETTIEPPKSKPKRKRKKKTTPSPIEDTLIEKEGDVITRLKEQDAVLKKIAEFPTEITGEVKTEQEIPIAEEARHYLHLLEYAGQEIDPLTNKPLSEYRLIISPFDEIITARWIKQRDVVTKHGFDVAPCDYWDTIYKTSIYYDPVGKEIAVYQLIYNSAMSEIGMFAPKVEKELKDKGIVALLDKHIIAEHLRLSAENLTLRKRVKWWEAYTKSLIDAKDDTGGKLFEHMMNIASELPETDRWKVAKDMSAMDKINAHFIKHPDQKMIIVVGGLVVLVIGLLYGLGILR